MGYAWINGNWSRIVGANSDDYAPITERAKLRNWLADQPEWPKTLPTQFKGWTLFSTHVEREGNNVRAEVIHKHNIDKLRIVRTRAGLISDQAASN